MGRDAAPNPPECGHLDEFCVVDQHLDLSDCEQEPIHIPGSIQPHGILLALDQAKQTLIGVSANCTHFLGRPPGALLGKKLTPALGASFRKHLSNAINTSPDQAHKPNYFTWTPPRHNGGHKGPLRCAVHTHGGCIFAECEPLSPREDDPALFIQAMEAFQRVHDAPQLMAKMQLAAELIKAYTGYDRVMIYRFDSDWSGEVIAEAVAKDRVRYLGLHYPASDIPPQARQLYLLNRVRMIADIDDPQVPLVQAHGDAPPLDLSCCQLRSVSPVHLEYLGNMGVKASLVSSLVIGNTLWGMIACHHNHPRVARFPVRQLCSLLSRDLALQVQLHLSQRQHALVARLSRSRDRVIAWLRAGSHFPSLMKSDLRRDLLDMVQAEGLALVIGGQVVSEGITPGAAKVRWLLKALRRNGLSPEQPVFVSDKLSATLCWSKPLARYAAGVLTIILPDSPSTALLWFRGERSRTVTWGGNPHQPAQRQADGRLHPRHSFAAWKEDVQGQSSPWLEEEQASARLLLQQWIFQHRQSAGQELRLLRHSVSQLQDAVLITEAEPLDHPGPRIVFVNDAFCRTTGYRASEVLGKTPRLLQGPDTERNELDRLRRALESCQPVHCELTNYRKNGTPFVVAMDISPVADESGCFTHLLSIQRDITARRQAEAKLLRSETQYQQLLAQLNDAVVVIDGEGCVHSHNRSAASLLEINQHDMDGQVLATQLLALRYPSDTPVPDQEHPALLRNAIQSPCREHYYMLTVASGKRYWISLNTRVMESVSSHNGQGVLLSFRDITEQYTLRHKLSRLAGTDVLTGLPNRTHFHAQLGAMLARARREDATVDVVLIDLDNFKDINDAFGHSYGDQLLCQVSERFQQFLEARELVARLGGDEFVACQVVPHRHQPRLGLADKLRNALALPLRLGKQELQVVASMGLARYPLDGDSAEELLRKADIAMYAAKRERGQGLRAYSRELEHSVQNHMAARLRLQRGLELEQFELHYQPKVSVNSGHMVGFEALIRWRDEQDKLIMPGDFIDQAESTGMIHPIGEWVIQQAINDLRLLADAGLEHLSIAVNISPSQFKRPDLVPYIIQLLARCGVAPKRLEVEITEAVLVNEQHLNWTHLEQFLLAGIRVFIDDFGTGYSSLAYLRQLPVAAMKIDRSFIHGATENADQAELVKTILNMARGLDLHTVAEGIEQPEELDLIKALGCDVYQGFYYSDAKPLLFFLTGNACAGQIMQTGRMERREKNSED